MTAAVEDRAPPGRVSIARVVPDLTGLDKQFDYAVPAELADAVHVGTIVRVPLGKRRVRAWVVDLSVDPAVEVESLKPIAAVVSAGPAADLVELAGWAAWRWAGWRRPFLLAASPPRVVKRVPKPAGRGVAPTAPDGERGGVVRVPPAADVLPVVQAAADRGPTLVVTPGVDASALLAARLRGSGRTVALVPGEWAAAAGGVDVVVGPRTAVWAPCPGLAAVVVVDEHDEALQDERSPTWHARDVAIERARRAGAACWLVSPAPSLEALAWAGDAVARPSRVDERAGWPIVEVVDRSRDDPAQTSVITRRLLEVARDPSQRVVGVVNIKGRARRLVCRACRASTTCEVCAAAVTQKRNGDLACGRCGATRPAVCQACGSTRLVALGIGVSRLRDELAAAIRRPVVEVSADAPAAGDDGPSDAVLLGTEAVLHRAHDATTVAFLDFDDELLAPRFRAAEEAMALLVRAARLVGGRAGGGRIIVQTHVPTHDVVTAALHADPARLVEREWARRSLLSFPPVAALAAVTGAKADEWTAGLLPPLEVSGPADGRWLVRAPSWAALADGLAAAGTRPRGIRVEVDPRRL